MARRLEELLFRGAATFDEYKQPRTLKKRLATLLLAMRARKQSRKQVRLNGHPMIIRKQSRKQSRLNDQRRLLLLCEAVIANHHRDQGHN